jgi:hypothetical protein
MMDIKKPDSRFNAEHACWNDGYDAQPNPREFPFPSVERIKSDIGTYNTNNFYKTTQTFESCSKDERTASASKCRGSDKIKSVVLGSAKIILIFRLDY